MHPASKKVKTHVSCFGDGKDVFKIKQVDGRRWEEKEDNIQL